MFGQLNDEKKKVTKKSAVLRKSIFCSGNHINSVDFTCLKYKKVKLKKAPLLKKEKTNFKIEKP